MCRSRNPDGPYEDALGQDMTECGGKDGTFFNDPDYEGYGVKLLGGYRFEPEKGGTGTGTAYRSPGHQMMMNGDGWPVVLPWRYAGESPETVPADRQAGVYRVVLHERDINKTEHTSRTVTLEESGAVTGDLTGEWSCPDGTRFECTLDGAVCRGVMTTAFDSEEKAWVTCFSARDETGAAVWGTRTAR